MCPQSSCIGQCWEENMEVIRMWVLAFMNWFLLPLQECNPQKRKTVTTICNSLLFFLPLTLASGLWKVWAPWLSTYQILQLWGINVCSWQINQSMVLHYSSTKLTKTGQSYVTDYGLWLGVIGYNSDFSHSLDSIRHSSQGIHFTCIHNFIINNSAKYM